MRTSILGFVLAMLGAQGAHAQDDWEQVSADAFSTVSARSVPGTAVKELRVQATLKWPATRLIALIGDVDNYPRFMPPTEETSSLGRTGAMGRWYIVINPPVISRRDYCVWIKIGRLSDGRLRSTFGRMEEGCPAQKKGLVRMQRVDGSWTLTPRANGTTFVEYQAITDPSGTVPTWMVNRATGDQIRDMFRSLDRAAADPKLAPCPGTSLGCVVVK